MRVVRKAANGQETGGFHRPKSSHPYFFIKLFDKILFSGIIKQGSDPTKKGEEQL